MWYTGWSFSGFETSKVMKRLRRRPTTETNSRTWRHTTVASDGKNRGVVPFQLWQSQYKRATSMRGVCSSLVASGAELCCSCQISLLGELHQLFEYELADECT
jgi:hypothetical protein